MKLPSYGALWADTMIDLGRLSYGGAAGIITSMALVNGFAAASAPKSTIVTSLFIVAIADNLTDSLSMHIYQESERRNGREALRTTLANFATRVATALSFIAAVLLLPTSVAPWVCLGWGFALLALLSALLAKARGVSAPSEIWKHCAVAVVVILVSRQLGVWITSGLMDR